MRPPFRWLLLLSFAVAALRAEASLAEARRAQALLGRDIWSRVLRIENQAGTGPYAGTLHALVFEFAGVLWFYTAADGTQSLSLHVGRLAEEKADLGPLLRDIEPGFRRWQELPDAGGPETPVAGRLRNGCFIESLVALRERLGRGLETVRPALLAYYAEQPSGMRGHTVLAFESDGRATVLDPERGGAERWFSRRLLEEPLALARRLAGSRVDRARLFPISAPPAWKRVFAASEPSADPADAAAGPRRAVSVR